MATKSQGKTTASETAVSGTTQAPQGDQAKEQTTAAQNTAASGTTAAPENDQAKPQKSGKAATVQAIEVSTVHGVNSFWRAGLHFTQEVRTLVLDDLEEAQVEAIKAEKKLAHKIVEIEKAIEDAV